MTIHELRRNNDLILLDSNSLYTFAKLYATLDECANLEGCDFWSESYPIIQAILNRLGFTVTDHEKLGVSVNYSDNNIMIKDFEIRL